MKRDKLILQSTTLICLIATFNCLLTTQPESSTPLKENCNSLEMSKDELAKDRKLQTEDEHTDPTQGSPYNKFDIPSKDSPEQMDMIVNDIKQVKII